MMIFTMTNIGDSEAGASDAQFFEEEITGLTDDTIEQMFPDSEN